MPLVAASRIDGRIRSGQLVLAAGEATFIAASWTSPRTCASVGDEGSHVDAPERQIIKDRAVGSIVAVTRGNQFPERIRHRLHLGDARLKTVNMDLGDALDLAAWSAPVAP